MAENYMALNYDVNEVFPVKLKNILSETKTEIATLIRDNDKITKLLKYDKADALENPLYVVDNKIRKEIYSQSSGNKRFFLMGFDPHAVKEVRSEIHVAYDRINTYQAGITKVPFLRIDVIVAVPINSLSDGYSMRHDVLFQLVNDTIEGHHVGTLGNIKLSENSRDLAWEYPLEGNTHVVWSAIYQIGEIKR